MGSLDGRSPSSPAPAAASATRSPGASRPTAPTWPSRRARRRTATTSTGDQRDGAVDPRRRWLRRGDRRRPRQARGPRPHRRGDRAPARPGRRPREQRRHHLLRPRRDVPASGTTGSCSRCRCGHRSSWPSSCCRGCAPRRWGAILNISSKGAIHPAGPPFGGGPGGTVYGMVKAALERFTTGLAAEVHDDNVRVNVLSPTAIVPTPGVVTTACSPRNANRRTGRGDGRGRAGVCHRSPGLTGRIAYSQQLLWELGLGPKPPTSSWSATPPHRRRPRRGVKTPTGRPATSAQGRRSRAARSHRARSAAAS